MKTVVAARAGISALFLGMLAAGPVSAQQTGGPPVPAPRVGAGAPIAQPQTPQPTVAPPSETPAPAEPAGSATTTLLSPAAAAAVSGAVSRPPQAARPGQTSLLLEVESTRPDTRISVAVYRDADSFRKGETPVRTLVLNRDGPVSRAFVLNLPVGRYAIVAWQDADGDGRPTRGRLGGAGEPIGYSRGAHARFGPPRFEEAAFELGAAGVTQRIVLRGR